MCGLFRRLTKLTGNALECANCQLAGLTPFPDTKSLPEDVRRQPFWACHGYFGVRMAAGNAAPGYWEPPPDIGELDNIVGGRRRLEDNVTKLTCDTPPRSLELSTLTHDCALPPVSAPAYTARMCESHRQRMSRRSSMTGISSEGIDPGSGSRISSTAASLTGSGTTPSLPTSSGCSRTSPSTGCVPPHEGG